MRGSGALLRDRARDACERGVSAGNLWQGEAALKLQISKRILKTVGASSRCAARLCAHRGQEGNSSLAKYLMIQEAKRVSLLYVNHV